MENAWVVPVIKDHATYVHEYRRREQLISSTNQIIVTSSLQPSSDPEQLLCGRVITVPSSYARRHQDLSPKSIHILDFDSPHNNETSKQFTAVRVLTR